MKNMTSGQLEAAEIIETIEIAEQGVRRRYLGSLKLLKHLKLLACVLVFCHTSEFFSETNPPLGTKHAKISKQMILFGI